MPSPPDAPRPNRPRPSTRRRTAVAPNRRPFLTPLPLPRPPRAGGDARPAGLVRSRHSGRDARPAAAGPTASPVRRLGDVAAADRSARGPRRARGRGVRRRLPRLRPATRPRGGPEGAAARRAGDHQTRRFLTEAKSAANLHHPNIVPLYEAGHDGAGTSTSPAPSSTANRSRTHRRRRIDPRRAADLVRRWRGLWRTRTSQGVVHRDVKPDNVLVDSRRASRT